MKNKHNIDIGAVDLNTVNYNSYVSSLVPQRRIPSLEICYPEEIINEYKRTYYEERAIQLDKKAIISESLSITIVGTNYRPTLYYAENILIDRIEEQRYMPILTNYIKSALNKATYAILSDGTVWGEIPECDGVWANEDTQQQCKQTLHEVLEEWIILKLIDNDELPVIDGISLGQVVELD